MPVDSLVVAALAAELKSVLLGGRVERAYQPEPEQIRLEVRLPRETRLVVASWRPESARVHLAAAASFTNPRVPPLFLSVLRKHLEGGRVVDVFQPGLERALCLDVEGLDDMGRRALRRLVFEMAGRQANIVLLDVETQLVIDAAKRVRKSMSRTRELWPGVPYTAPPKPERLDPLRLLADEGRFRAAWALAPDGVEAARWLVDAFFGISPLIAKEIAYRAGGGDGPRRSRLDGPVEARASADRLRSSLAAVFGPLLSGGADGHRESFAREPWGNEFPVFLPTLITAPDAEDWVDISACHLSHLPEERQVSFLSMSLAVEEFFRDKDARAKFEKRKQSLLGPVRNSLEKARLKLSRQQEELSRASDAERWKLFGELLTANLGRVRPGDKEITVPNYYSETLDPIAIPLDPSLTPSANAQAYFRRYARARRARVEAGERVRETTQTVAFLESLEQKVAAAATDEELGLLERDFARHAKPGRAARQQAGTARAWSKPGPGEKSAGEKTAGDDALPLRYRSSDGLIILVGRNSRQNDRLTMETARPGDVWLHAKDIPGSHVIIRAPEGRGLDGVPETTLLEAAALAARHSRARLSSKVPVDYTERRHVRKPPGSPFGYVIYDHHRTVFVNPSSASGTSLLTGDD